MYVHINCSEIIGNSVIGQMSFNMQSNVLKVNLWLIMSIDLIFIIHHQYKKKWRLVLQWNTSRVNVWPSPTFLQLFSLLGTSGKVLTLTWMWKEVKHLREWCLTYFSPSVLAASHIKNIFVVLRAALRGFSVPKKTPHKSAHTLWPLFHVLHVAG